MHLYAYCYNNPINFSDPTGHTPEYYQKTVNYKVRGKGSLKVKFDFFKDWKTKRVVTYSKPKSTKTNWGIYGGKIVKNQITPLGRGADKINVRVALGLLKFFNPGWVKPGTSLDYYLIVDINIYGNGRPTVKSRKKVLKYKAYKKWKWGKFH